MSDAPGDFEKLKSYALEGSAPSPIIPIVPQLTPHRSLRLAPPVSGVTRAVKAQPGTHKD
ncbi:hypothetical protein IMZ48_19840, partial [Candidatus Bathyarchaeota archaeon]|nr:hypothetical protein [Candidatus Bathyarchaeota archaeon]